MKRGENIDEIPAPQLQSIPDHMLDFPQLSHAYSSNIVIFSLHNETLRRVKTFWRKNHSTDA